MRAGERPGGEIAAAFAMLTAIPVRSSSRDATGAAAYGLVGALVGALGGLVMIAVGDAVPTLAAVLAVTVIALRQRRDPPRRPRRHDRRPAGT